MHFAMNSALARGDGATALAVADQFRGEFMGDEAVMSRLLASSVHYAAGLHGDVDEVLGGPEPETALDKALHHYARGEALTRIGDARRVAAEAQALARLRDGTDSPALGRFGTPLAEVFQHVLEGRAAMMAGDHAAAATAYRKAMETQLAAGFGSDPPIFWYSVRRSLAAALLAGGDAEAARNQLLASLRRWPNDGLALFTLSLAERRLGDVGAADRSLDRARAAWAGDVTQVPLSRI
jgi:tetratricopeptide (TPR) repeat protein